MELELLLSVMNLNKEKLKKMNITSKCTVINQCGKNGEENYENFKLYSYNETGLSNSRNRGLEHISEDIILLCDDDVVYNENYEKIIIQEFEKNHKADLIIFNINSPNRPMKINTKNKKLHFYNILRYESTRIAFRKECVLNKQIKFNPLFGAGATYKSGEDSLFLVDCLKKRLNIYSSTKNIGTVYHVKSTWFKGYNEKYFFDKGALFTAINKDFRLLLILQYLLRHKEIIQDIKFYKAFNLMLKGSNEYIDICKKNRKMKV